MSGPKTKGFGEPWSAQRNQGELETMKLQPFKCKQLVRLVSLHFLISDANPNVNKLHEVEDAIDTAHESPVTSELQAAENRSKGLCAKMCQGSQGSKEGYIKIVLDKAANVCTASRRL